MENEPTPPEEPFVKKGVVTSGKTPSVVSGEKSETIKHGAACRQDETPVSLETVADLL